MHCYDVVDHSVLNPEIGSEKEFDSFLRTLNILDMGMILDIVPNHMAADSQNQIWYDTLEKGTRSKFAYYFDIDWNASAGTRKVILPFLDSTPRDAIESGQIRLESRISSTNEHIALIANDKQLPLSEETNLLLAGDILRRLGYEKKFRLRLDDLVNQENGDPVFLERILRLQNYDLVSWRDGLGSLNYRRFFNVNDLVAIRMEVDRVFNEAHSLVLRWLSDGKIWGLRIDHPDGLWEPAGYFEELQRRSSHNHRTSDQENRIYMLAEKILTGSENLSKDWYVSGTTGYDFLNDVNRIFIDRENEEKFVKLYQEFTKNTKSFWDTCFESKLRMLESYMQPDLKKLEKLALNTSRRHGRMTRFSPRQLRRAIMLVVACFPVYRTYMTMNQEALSENDRKYWKAAFDEAALRSRNSTIETKSALRFLESIALRKTRSSNGKIRTESRRFVMRFQQLSSAVFAKGVEDTAFYRYTRLASLNEVGGDPGAFGMDLAQFHRKNMERSKKWPHSMLASSTHDTKRSEDLRARINVLSELPEEWDSQLKRWRKWNRKYKSSKESPTPNDEYLLYQTILGAIPWTRNAKGSKIQHLSDPNFIERIVAYMGKASKEENLKTSWLFPNEAYGKDLDSFVRNVLSPGNRKFLQGMEEFALRIALFGAYNSLSQLLLKLTCPGVPDIYQGNELWDLSLVDPDNRRQIDFGERVNTLFQLSKKISRDRDQSKLARKLLEEIQTGRIKLFITMKVLKFRAQYPRLFGEGEYVPLSVTGECERNVCAFSRCAEGSPTLMIVAVSRFLTRIVHADTFPLGDALWAKTNLKLPVKWTKKLNFQDFRNVLTGETIRPQLDQTGRPTSLKMSDVFRTLPVAILTSD